MKINLKTPVSYYGGKQTLAPKILKLIPEHNLYCEPFLGGAAIFFAKQKSNVEVINDTNREVINFYKVVQQDFAALEKEVRISLHSRSLHTDAKVIYNAPHLFSEVKRAWAFWVLASQSFSGSLEAGFSYTRQQDTVSKKIKNKREAFTEDLAIRLQNVQLECADALYVIKSRDSEESFFYCDPPYFNAVMGHYDGYTEEDFENLLKTLSSIKGKFLLSSYPCEVLSKYTEQFEWHTVKIEQAITAANPNTSTRRKKIEVLTANYSL